MFDVAYQAIRIFRRVNRYIAIIILIIGISIIPIEGYSYIYQNISDMEMQKSLCCKTNSQHNKCQHEKHSCTSSLSCVPTINLHISALDYEALKKNTIAGVKKLPANYKELYTLPVYFPIWVPPKI